MSNIAGTLEIVKDAGALAVRAADIIAGKMEAATVPFRLVLSGGNTPRPVYEALAGRGLDWRGTDIFFGDERFVPADDPRSNFRMARLALLDKIAPRGLFPIPTGGAPEDAADRYAEVLRHQYGAVTLKPDVPLFHLTLLGLGDDGHTASLLPGQPVLREREKWVAVVPKGRENPRITLTYPALEASRMILFLVSGADKHDALVKARAGKLPAGALKPHGQVLWLVDRQAAGRDK